MLKIMLVDDEDLVLEYLEHMIDWEKQGYRIVGQVSSGRQALELYEKYRPEIVMADIRMPGMDGLELTKKLKEKNKDVVVILMSAYKDFEYAQKGIQYGVSNYLLKHELQEKKILAELDTVRKELEKLKERKKIYQSHLMKQLISGQKMTEDIEDFCAGNRLFLLLLHKNAYIIHGEVMEEEWKAEEEEVVREILTQGNTEQCLYVSDVQVTGNNWIILYQLESIASKYAVNCLIEQKSEQIVRSLSNRSELHVQVIYSYEITLREIGRTFREMAWQIRYAFFREPDRAYALTLLPEILPTEKQFLGDKVKKLHEAVHERDEESKKIVRAWFSEIEEKKQLDAFKALMPLLEQILAEAEECEERREERRLWTVKETGEYYAECFERIHRELCERDTESYSRLVSDVIQYLKKHYNEDLSLDTLGEVFKMNGPYLGRIFRKETGNTILKYVTNLRIEKAKQFLSVHNYTVSETAYHIGYQTSQYFSQIFTREVGINPQEYKKWKEKGRKMHS